MRLYAAALASALVLVLSAPAEAQTCEAEINTVSAELGQATNLAAADLERALELLQTAKSRCAAGDEAGALAAVEEVRQLLAS